MKKARMTRDEQIAKYGKAWRYVFLLERELKRRKTRQSFIRSSLGLNVVLILYILWGIFA